MLSARFKNDNKQNMFSSKQLMIIYAPIAIIYFYTTKKTAIIN